MQSWLVTVDQTVTDDEAFARLVAAGAQPDPDSDVIVFDDTERAITVTATPGIAAGLDAFPWVRGVFPNSEMQAY